MLIIDWIREKIKSFLQIEHIHNNPNTSTFQYISDQEKNRIAKAHELKLWYMGNSAEIEYFYMKKDFIKPSDYATTNYFWARALREAAVKKVHSGLANATVMTLVNVIGDHIIKSQNTEVQKLIDNIMDYNDFTKMVYQEQLPLTIAQGWGAFKFNIDKQYKYPLIEYYEAENVRFIGKNRRIEAIIYLNYYEIDKKKYVLFETRSLKQDNETKGIKAGSYVEYNLFLLGTDNNITPVKLSEVPELSNLQPIFIPSYKNILGVPCRILHNPNDKYYGLGIFESKIDILDDIDQALSQASQTVRVSTPVEYYPTSLLEKTPDGNPVLPKAYNRQFIEAPSNLPGPDGTVGSERIQTTQPQLNFNQYQEEVKNKIDIFLTGILSPATMGIDIAKKDNAEAQREKEKITLMTRNNIIASQRKIIKEVMEIALDLTEFMQTDKITFDKEYDFSVIYNEFGGPSFESKLQALTPAYNSGAISTERYVEALWGDMLNDSEKQEEINKLNEIRARDNLDLGSFESDDIYLDESSIDTNTTE